MRNDRDWRAIDRQRRADDWRYAGDLLLRPFEVVGALIALALVGVIASSVFFAAVLIRLAPLIVAVFAAIILSRCAGVL